VWWGFDVDSVVGDLSGVLVRVAEEVYGIQVSPEQFTRFRLEECLPFEPDFISRWITQALEPRWTALMEPYPGAVKVLTELSASQPLRFVTARPDAEPIRGWLVEQLPRVSVDRIQMEAVGHADLKLRVLRGWGITHFVEDHVETCRLLERNDIVPIVFEQPWNRGLHAFASVRSWSEIGVLVMNGCGASAQGGR
jgi:hypothetical protein